MTSIEDFVARLDEHNEIIHFTEEVSWKYQIGEITRQELMKLPASRALLFENVQDYPGHRVLTNGFSSIPKICIALGIEPDTHYPDIHKILINRFLKTHPPVVIESGEDWENVLIGDNVDLKKLPVPWWSQEDRSRYIGTWHINVTKDPESGKRNIGIYRMQLVDRKTAYISFSSRSDIKSHLDCAERLGLPLPMAVAIGVDERFIIAAAAAVPTNEDEYCHAGGLLQRPAELVKCREVDLEVPKGSEIILEGYIRPHERAEEGPFLDYAGIPKGNPKACIFDVAAMYFRKTPIFRGAAIGTTRGEDFILYTLLADVGFLDFHGSRIRHVLQNYFLRKRFYGLFQFSGRINSYINR